MNFLAASGKVEFCFDEVQVMHLAIFLYGASYDPKQSPASAQATRFTRTLPELRFWLGRVNAIFFMWVGLSLIVSVSVCNLTLSGGVRVSPIFQKSLEYLFRCKTIYLSVNEAIYNIYY